MTVNSEQAHSHIRIDSFCRKIQDIDVGDIIFVHVGAVIL